MKKLNVLTRMLLLVALLVGSVSAWGTDVIFTFGKTNRDVSSTDAVTKDGITVTVGDQENDSYNTDANDLRIYSGKSFTVAATTGKNISKLVITFTTNAYAGAVSKACFDKTGTYSSSKNVGTFTLSSVAQSVVFTKQGSGQVRISQVVVTYESSAYHTLSSAVNPTGVGTVSLGATSVDEGKYTTIEATVINADYRFKNWTYTGTGASVANVNLASTTFTMGTSDANVTANFELIPTHKVNVTTPSGGTITIKKGDDEIVSGSDIKEGTVLTIIAVAGPGKKFNSWSLTGATPTTSTSTTTTFTMGVNDVTIAANFDDVVTYPIHWSVNGSVVKTDNVEENTAISFPSSIGGVPTGYTLKGWSESQILTPQATDAGIFYVTSAKSKAETTYYAVMAVGHEEETTGELNGSDITSEFSNHGYDDDEETETIDGVDWTFRGSRAAANPWMQIRSNTKASYIIVEADGPISSVYLQISNATNSAGGANDISKHGDFNGTVYLESEYQSSPSGELGSSTVEASAKEVTINVSPSNSTVVIQASGACRIWDVKATYTGTAYSGYCTSVPPVPVEVSALGYATFASDKALDFTDKSIKAYKATVDGTTVNFTQVYVVPAGEGVLLYAPAGASIDVPVATDAAATAAADNFTGNKLVRGTGAALTYAEGTAEYYILANETAGIGFYKAKNNMVATNRAYLDLTGTGGAKSFVLPGGETDGIRSIDNSELRVENSNYYNLAGQRVGKDYKGIVIVNGKKIVRK